MDSTEDSIPSCILKCLRNVGDNVSDSEHQLKYGVNTIGRGLNNDITVKNINVSRTHCHIRVVKEGSKDIAFIQDLGTSNGSFVGNTNLTSFEEYQLNDLDMIVLASDDEGVVLQFIIDQTITLNKLNNNKRKELCVDDFEEPTAMKIPKLTSNEQDGFKEPFSNENKNLSNKLIHSSNIVNNLQHTYLNKPTSPGDILKSVNEFNFQNLSTEDPKIESLNNIKPSCSHHKNNIPTSVPINVEPETISNIYSQGTYRNEEDSVIVIYSSDEEINTNAKHLEIPNIKIEQQKHINLSTTLMKNTYSSTLKVENNQNHQKCSIVNDIIEILSDDENNTASPQLNSDNNINYLLSSSDSDNDYNNKCLKIIEPIPMIPKLVKEQTKALAENKIIIKTRAKSEKKKNIKKKAEAITVDKNKQIIKERRKRLQQLTNKNNCTSSSTDERTLTENPSTNDSYIDKPSTSNILKKKCRISRIQQNGNYNCMPSTSKSHFTTEIEKNDTSSTIKEVKFNLQKVTSKIDNNNYSNNIGSSLTFVNQNKFAYFDTISIICKWNAVWLREEKYCDRFPPLVGLTTTHKMKQQYENSSEYSSIVKSLLLCEIWSKISESYNMVFNKYPKLEKYIFEKSLKDYRSKPLLTFHIESVNKDFSTSIQGQKPLYNLWCLKCKEVNTNNKETLTETNCLLQGYLCIVLIQSEHFETNTVKKPTKSKNIFFAYVHETKKIGVHSNSQLYIKLIITKKSENIPNGTPIHLMNIVYLQSELRLFQALNNVSTSSLSNALILPQAHNYNIDYSKSLMLNDSQKNAVKMAITICLSKEPNVGLIIGPPGTGKTNVICNIVLTLMSKVQTMTDTKPKLLLCAPSNEAVDSLVGRIIEIKKHIKYELNVVRVGNGQKYNPYSPIVDVMLDTLVKHRINNPLNEDDQPGQLNTWSVYNKKELGKHILQNADVVVTTLNSSFSNDMQNAFTPSTIQTLNNCHFTACIIDEAGQCIEPLNYVPMLLGIDKLILVGDDKQLQPIVRSKIAKENGFGISLFKRLKTWFEQKHYKLKNYPITMLDTQYRMHNEICLFPSKYFYKGLINTAPSVNTREQLPFLPYIILEHESRQDNSGEVNIGEANMIVSLVEILLKSECNSLAISVLTPYHRQREHIDMLLRNKEISLNVNTIDSFQGGECDILLISTVRTNGVGFMDDICRLNVALTRARQSLIICGNFMSLRREKIWLNLLEDAKKRKLLKGVSKRVMTNSKTLLAMIKL